jgi:tRNA A64-2'-O-ribosylphosphate transferase
MPDALSKTIPIWCTVFNRLLFPDLREVQILNTPPKTVSASERSQIEERLDGFVRELKNLDIDVSGIRSKVTKPLRPIWITRDSILPDNPPRFSDFYPVILVTASRRVSGHEMLEGGYIQGAGDDSEGWSRGLTALMFWQNHQELLKTSEGRLHSLISELVENGAGTKTPQGWAVIQPASWLIIGTTRSLQKSDIAEGTLVIDCVEESDKVLAAILQSRYLHLKCRPKKLGSRDLRKELPKILRLISATSDIRQLYICCLDGKDVSVGVALAFLCLFSDSSGSLRAADDNQSNPRITKQFIQHRLSWIMTSFPDASPSRATLQSINDFLFTSITHFPSASPLTQSRSNSQIATIFDALSGG